MKRSGFFHAKLIPCLPDNRHPDMGRKFPAGMVGATIVGIGTLPHEADVEGGGLVIDYLEAGSNQAKRLVLGFTELGMWIESQLPL
jgi:hypothetical protein